MLEMFKSLKGKEDDMVASFTAADLLDKKVQLLVKKYGITDERAKAVIQGGK